MGILLYSCNIPLPFNHFKLSGIPGFNADSAYNNIVSLVKPGPRVPNTPAHDSALHFITSKLKSYGYNVTVQSDTALRYDSVILNINNIFAKYPSDNKKRILLFTHWDTRFMAEYSNDSTKKHEPFSGANDSGSGVGIMLEIARLVAQNPPHVAVDFLFLDAEDQGPPYDFGVYNMKYWCLCSKKWIEQNKDYKPLYAIGLDMVGSKYAKFAIEDNSLYYYGYLVKKIWQAAAQLGYDTLFLDRRTHGLYNDHVVISQNSNIRAVMIVENIPGKPYGNYWHTHKDSLQIIGKKTLKAVGQTVLTVIYNQK